jgi:DNA helicase HerA-like ATPase
MSGRHNLSTGSDRTSIAVTKITRQRLQALKRELGFRNLSALFNYAILELTKEGLIPPAEYSVIFEKLGTRPVVITGESGAGKTTTVRDLLSKWEGSAFILDVTNEYPDFRKVDLGAIFGADWGKPGQRIRFVSNSNVEASRGEASAIFGQLNYLKNSGALRDWVIVIEEGHRFSQDANLRALLIEGRKFARKVILVTTDFREFGGIARTFKPRPWEPI